MERMESDPCIFTERVIVSNALEAVGAFVSGICECLGSTSPLPRQSVLATSTHVRRQEDPQGTLEFPEGFGE